MTVQVREQTKTPLWRNATVLKWTAQLVVLAAVVGLFILLGEQAFSNFSKSDISFGWDWLADPTGVAIREGIDTSPDSGARALLVGMVNTLRVAISGIFVATILGIFAVIFIVTSFVGVCPLYNLIGLSQAWVAAGRLGIGAALLGLHGAAAALALGLLAWRDQGATHRLWPRKATA